MPNDNNPIDDIENLTLEQIQEIYNDFIEFDDSVFTATDSCSPGWVTGHVNASYSK